MLGAFFGGLKNIITGWIIRFALMLVDKAVAGALNGVMDENTKIMIGNRVDEIVDKIQRTGTETGKSVRKTVIGICESIITKLKEANGVN